MKKLRACAVLAVVVLAACGGAVEEPPAEQAAAPAEEAAAAEAPMDDAAVLDEMTEYYVTHYNMHHPDMVAELYAEDAVVLGADGGIWQGREAILASLEEDMASEPTLSVDVADRIITGEWAVTRGSWSVESTPEGAPEAMVVGGNWMSGSRKINGEWKIGGLITQFDQAPPEEMPTAEPPAEAPPDNTDSPLAELSEYYATHFNMGHGDMVASRYAEDAVAAFADSPLLEGRTAIAEGLNALMVERDNPQLTIHEVEAQEIGDGWVLAGGWWELTSSSTGNSSGAYMSLSRPGDDGNMQIHWHVSNGRSEEQ